MKKLYTFIGLSLGVVMLLLISACNRQSQAPRDRPAAKKTPEAVFREEPKAASFPTNDAIAYGMRFAATMPGDVDAVLTQSKMLEQVAQACLQHGDLERAFAVAKTIKGWQRGSACADVARSYALTGRTNDARRALLEAEAWCALFREQTRESSMGWVCSRIRQHIVIARTILGETNAYAIVQQPIDNVSPTVLNRLVASDTNRESSAFMQTLSVLMTNKDLEVQQGLGLGVLAWAAKQPALSTQALDEVVAVVKVSLKSQPELLQIPVQQNLVHLLHANGRTDDATRMTRELETFVRGMPAGYPRGISLADVATVWSAIDTNRTALLLDEACQQIDNSPGSSQPYGYAHIAERLCDMGQTNRAQEIYRKAFDASVLMQQPTPRLQRLIGVCASIGGAGVPLTPELRDRLNELAAKEEEAAITAPKVPVWASGDPEKK